MRKTIAITFLALGLLLLIFCVAFTVVQLTVAETGWFEQEFTKLSLAQDMGMTLGDLGASIRTLVDYMNGKTETIDVLVTVNGQQVRMFNLDVEIVHMAEVRDLWQWFIGVRNVGILAGLVLCLGGVVLDGKDAFRNACMGYFWALGLFLVLVAFAVCVSASASHLSAAVSEVSLGNNVRCLAKNPVSSMVALGYS